MEGWCRSLQTIIGSLINLLIAHQPQAYLFRCTAAPAVAGSADADSWFQQIGNQFLRSGFYVFLSP